LLKAQTEVVVKHENHTPIGAFKVRGGDRLKVTATRGNHGQSLAFAGAAPSQLDHAEVDSSVMGARKTPAHVGACGTDHRISRTILPNTSPRSLSSCATAMSRNGKRRPTVWISRLLWRSALSSARQASRSAALRS
jgi:hypothetical protein